MCVSTCNSEGRRGEEGERERELKIVVQFENCQSSTSISSSYPIRKSHALLFLPL